MTRPQPFPTLTQVLYEQRERRAAAHDASARALRTVGEKQLLDLVPMSFRAGDAWFDRAVKAATIVLDLRRELADAVERVTVRPLGNGILLVSAHYDTGADARQCERARFVAAWGEP